MQPDIDENSVKEFLQPVAVIFIIFDSSWIINVEEKFWAPVGSEGVSIISTGDEKSGFTAETSISASNDTFPLIVISLGTTTRCEANWFGRWHSIRAANRVSEQFPNLAYNKTSS